MSPVLAGILMGCIGVVLVSMAFCFARFFMGPSLADRIMSVDTLALNLVALVALTAMAIGTDVYFPLVLIFSLVGFLSTLCVAKYLSGGPIF